MRNKTLVLAALAAAGAMTLQPTLSQHPAVQVVAPASKKRRRSLFGGTPYNPFVPYGRKGAGVSVAQHKRQAKKARNVARNRAAHR